MSPSRTTTQERRTSHSFLLLLCLLAVLCCSKVVLVDAIIEIPLPHIDIFMLCSKDVVSDNDGNTQLNYKKEMDGFFSDLIPSALDIVFVDDNSSEDGDSDDAATTKQQTRGGGVEIIDCPGHTGLKQVRMTSDGMYVEIDNHNPLTEGDIKSLVKKETLESYFSSKNNDVCKDLYTFEAIVRDAGSEPKSGKYVCMFTLYNSADSLDEQYSICYTYYSRKTRSLSTLTN